MNKTRPYFIFLSEIIGLPIIDKQSNKKIGFVYDVVALFEDTFPVVKGLIIKKNFKSENYYLPLSQISEIIENKTVYAIECENLFDSKAQLDEKFILLKETFWDKQIVNISGSKVVRVNDLQLLRENSIVIAVHIDVGFTGFLRRLGWYKIIFALVQFLFSYELEDKLITWKYIQPISYTSVFGSLQLKKTAQLLQKLHPEDIADILLDLGFDDRLSIFKSLEKELAAKTLQELPQNFSSQIADSISVEKLTEVINELPIDEAVDIIEELSFERKNDLFELLPQDTVSEISELMEHSHRSAGSLMNTDFAVARHNETIADILMKIKTEFIETESLYYVYIIDDEEKLIGVVTLRKLLSSEPNEIVKDLLIQNVVSVDIYESVKNVAKVFFKYNFHTLPVIDEENKIQGIITLKDAFEEVFPEIRKEKEE